MTSPSAHYVFGTTAAYSHVAPLTQLAASLVTLTPDLLISIILHTNNVSNATTLLQHLDAESRERIKLCSAGEKTAWRDSSGAYMSLLESTGPLYAQILMVSWHRLRGRKSSKTGHQMARTERVCF